MSDIKIKELNRQLEKLFEHSAAVVQHVSDGEAESLMPDEEQVGLSRAESRRVAMEPFSPFNLNQMDIAVQFLGKYENIINAALSEEEGKQQMVQAFSQDCSQSNKPAALYGMTLLLIHHPELKLNLPVLEKQYPHLFQTKHRQQPMEQETFGTDERTVLETGVQTSERDIRQFREDVLLNEHHLHWHAVYLNDRVLDRGGEMFLYMHRQMLARYNAERLSVGLEEVVPFSDYNGIVDTVHPDGEGKRRLSGDQIDLLTRGRDALLAKLPLYLKKPEKAIDLLGNDTEPRRSNEPENRDTNLNFHGEGHMAVADLSLEDEIMGHPATACRHPFFWRWHKEVDQLYHKLASRLPAHRFNDSPEVRMNHIILCREDGLPREGDLRQLATVAFADWDSQFTDGVFQANGPSITTTSELHTSYKSYQEVTYLTHSGFAYFIRVENLSSRELKAAIRIFIAPKQTKADYRSWIEMDKFVATLAPGKNILYQNARESSVVKKPAVEMPSESRNADKSECQCGWPYTLLLPRGNEEGMEFEMLVMLTDWEEDQLQESTCGSISFCGSANAQDRYPDGRPLGYPIDRPALPDLQTVLATNPHMATRSFTIRHLGWEK